MLKFVVNDKNFNLVPYNEAQRIQIQLGLKENLDVSKYANLKYNASQMFEIRLGLKENLDVSRYADPELTFLEMSKVRQELEREKVKQNEESNDYT